MEKRRIDAPRRHERGAQGRFRLAPEIKIESGLERQRQWEAPSSIDGEEVLKFGQANYDGGTRFKSTWKPGFLYLTENRALFFQGANRVVDIPVVELESIAIVTREWIPGRTAEQLCLIQRSRNVKRTFHMRMTKPEGWKDALEETLAEYADKGHVRAVELYRDAERAVEQAWTPKIQEAVGDEREAGYVD